MEVEEGRVTGTGKCRVRPHTIPWIARVAKKKDVDEDYPDVIYNPRRHYCGGTIIHTKHVLTAAHCVCGEVWFVGAPKPAICFTPKLFVVLLGEHEISEKDGEQRFDVKSIYKHPKYFTAGNKSN